MNLEWEGELGRAHVSEDVAAGSGRSMPATWNDCAGERASYGGAHQASTKHRRVLFWEEAGIVKYAALWKGRFARRKELHEGLLGCTSEGASSDLRAVGKGVCSMKLQ